MYIATTSVQTSVECTPWAAVDPCEYANRQPSCAQEGLVEYLPLFYCWAENGHPGWSSLLIVGMFVWLSILFFVMSKTTEVFLCPAMEHLAFLANLAPDVAGITLFAFASGAPDLFTQISALDGKGHGDLPLAISATFGSGLFIICVVFATIVLSSGKESLVIEDKFSYVRDSIAYGMASALCLILLLYGDDGLGFWDGVILVLGYLVYLVVSLCFRSAIHSGHHSEDLIREHPLTRTPVFEDRNGYTGDMLRTKDSGAVELQPLTTDIVISQMSIPGGNDQTTIGQRQTRNAWYQGEDRNQVIMPSKADGNSSWMEEIQLGSRIPSVSVEKPYSPELTPLRYTTNGQSNKNTLGSVFEWVVDITEFRNAHGMMKLVAIITAPCVIMLHLTIPDASKGTFGIPYLMCMSVCAPIFFLLQTDLISSTHWIAFTSITAGISAILIILTLTLIPETPIQHLSPHLSDQSDTTSDHVLCSTSWTSLRPRKNLVFAIIASIQAIIWLQFTAGEVVSIFESLGTVWRVPRELLGATLLSLLETIPDLLLVLSLSRAGNHTTALGACFGGPVFNLLLSMALPLTIAAGIHGQVPYSISWSTATLILATIVFITATMILVPYTFHWSVPKSFGYLCIFVYVCIQVTYILLYVFSSQQ